MIFRFIARFSKNNQLYYISIPSYYLLVLFPDNTKKDNPNLIFIKKSPEHIICIKDKGVLVKKIMIIVWL